MRANVRRALAAMALLTLFGCARAPRPGIPIESARLEEIAAAVAARAENGPLRATGTGELAVGDDRQAFSFALVYDPPAWLRMDARPLLGSMSPPWSVSALLDGDLVTAHFPNRDAWVADRLRKAVPGIERVDTARFLVGRPDAGVLMRLSHARVVRAGTDLVISGDVYGREVTVAVDTTSSVIRRIEVLDGRSAHVTVRYGVATVDATGRVPGAVDVRYENGTTLVELGIDYDRVRPVDVVVRDAHALAVPAGALTLRWEDIGLGRTP